MRYAFAFAFVMMAALGLARTGFTPADVTQRYDVPFPQRLAITPMIDGRYDEEEWDALCPTAEAPTAMQWEPNMLYLGALVPKGKDVVFTLDLRGDGWLIGNDNLEIRATWDNGAPQVSARMLDATNRNSPVWIAQPLLEGMIRSAGIMEDDKWTLEMAVPSAFGFEFVLGRTIGVRSDVANPGENLGEAYVPRTCTLVFLRYERGRNLPSGIEWAPEYKVRNVVPGESINIRLTFRHKGPSPFKRIELHTEGLGKDDTLMTALPFPEFDRKGRSFVDYATTVSGQATHGYRVLRGTLTGAPGDPMIVESSYRISPLLDFDVSLPTNLQSSPDSRVIKGKVTLYSNTPNRLDGILTLGVPDSWSIARGQDRKFTIYHSRGTAIVNFELIAPQGARGLIPLAFTAKIGDKTVQLAKTLAIQ